MPPSTSIPPFTCSIENGLSRNPALDASVNIQSSEIGASESSGLPPPRFECSPGNQTWETRSFDVERKDESEWTESSSDSAHRIGKNDLRLSSRDSSCLTRSTRRAT